MMSATQWRGEQERPANGMPGYLAMPTGVALTMPSASPSACSMCWPAVTRFPVLADMRLASDAARCPCPRRRRASRSPRDRSARGHRRARAAGAELHHPAARQPEHLRAKAFGEARCRYCGRAPRRLRTRSC